MYLYIVYLQGTLDYKYMLDRSLCNKLLDYVIILLILENMGYNMSILQKEEQINYIEQIHSTSLG